MDPLEAPARGHASCNSIPPANSDQKHDVLGCGNPRRGPRFRLVRRRACESLITIGVLTLIGAILLTTVALVTRFFRGTWNP